MSSTIASTAVCAVLVTWQPDQQFGIRLARIRAQVDQVFVVDNASTGTALETLRQATAPAELLQNSANLGVAAAFNRGIAAARSAGFVLALLLDQDSWPNDDMVAQLSHEWQAAGAQRPGVLGAGFSDSGRKETSESATVNSSEPVDWVITSGSLIDTGLWQQLGGFRDDFFIDFVDTEYCQRVRQSGHAVLRTRAILMQHSIGAHTSHRILGHVTHTSNHSADRRYYITRNFMVMMRESGRYPFGLWILRGIWASAKSIRRIVLYESGKADKLHAILQGWRDGMTGRMGQRTPRLSAPMNR